jgi:CSLREA domain-containing protein
MPRRFVVQFCGLFPLLLAFFLLALSTATPAYAVGETVVTTTTLANDPSDGKCSLREAL